MERSDPGKELSLQTRCTQWAQSPVTWVKTRRGEHVSSHVFLFACVCRHSSGKTHEELKQCLFEGEAIRQAEILALHILLYYFLLLLHVNVLSIQKTKQPNKVSV